MKTKNPVAWFEIYVDDLQRARQFYETVLNIKLNEMPMPKNSGDDMKMLAFPMEMQGDGAGGALVKMEGFNAGGNSVIVYFSSDDCAIEESIVEKAGGKIFKSKLSLGEYGAMVLAFDTEGNMFGVHSQS